MHVISADDLFRASAFSKGCNGKRVKVFFYNLNLSIICDSVLLEYLLNMVTLDYMLLIMVCTVYHYVFLGGAVAFDPVGQLSEFVV